MLDHYYYLVVTYYSSIIVLIVYNTNFLLPTVCLLTDVYAAGKRRMAVGGMTSSSDVIARSPTTVSVSVSLLLSIYLSYRTCCVRQLLTASVQ